VHKEQVAQQILCSDARTDELFKRADLLKEGLSCLQVYGGGVAVAMLACVPDWPYFNKHPESWLPSQKQVAAAAKPMVAR